MTSKLRTTTALGSILEAEGRTQRWIVRRTGWTVHRVSCLAHGILPTQEEAETVAALLGREVAECFPEHIEREASAA